MVKYSAPRIEDFGTIETQVYSIGSPPNGEFPPPENGPVPTTTEAGGGGGGLGLLGIAIGGIAAAVAGRNNSPAEPVVGPVEDEEKEARAFD